MGKTSAWDQNLSMLHEAIDYLTGKGGLPQNAWEEIANLLPSSEPQPYQGDNAERNNLLQGLEAVARFRLLLFQQNTKNSESISAGSLNNAFQFVQNEWFPITKEYENKALAAAGSPHSDTREAENIACGYKYGSCIVGTELNGVYRITGKASENPAFWGYCIVDSDLIESKYSSTRMLSELLPEFYFNGVDHFFTNLIWLVVAGIKGGNALSKANRYKTHAIHCSFEDCGISISS